MPDDAPLHEWAGLAQRIVILAVLFPARIVLSLRLLRLAGPVTAGPRAREGNTDSPV
jgi:hypothetical protein